MYIKLSLSISFSISGKETLVSPLKYILKCILLKFKPIKGKHGLTKSNKPRWRQERRLKNKN